MTHTHCVRQKGYQHHAGLEWNRKQNFTSERRKRALQRKQGSITSLKYDSTDDLKIIISLDY